MLKVVGASWVQTRITLFTLAAVTLVGILTYYYGGVAPPSHDGNYAATVYWSRTAGYRLQFWGQNNEPLAIRKGVARAYYRPDMTNNGPSHDGNYAATVYWSRTAGYRLQFWGQNNEPSAIRKGVARAYYRPDMTNDGWASMEIETMESYPDTVQAHAAGLLEGSLSWQLIYYHWKNTIERTCEDRQDFCEQARIILDQNTVNIREQAKALDHVDPFWHQVNLFYQQLDGLEVGWRYAVDRSRKDVDIPHQDFLWMNMACDLRDLELMYNATLETNPHRPSLSMALLKLVSNDSSQFLLAHASSTFYSAMLRVQKRYHFGFHMTGASGTAMVPGQVVAFTSYPGTIHSQDDFYQVSGTGTPLTVSGTAIKNFNQSLWERAEVTTQAFMGPRVMAANRLAVNGSHWSQLVDRSYSGTGNKQWLVVQPGGETVKLWVVEQVPGITHAESQTKLLNSTGYWASYGLPHYMEILNVVGNGKLQYQSSNSVAKVLSVGQSNVTDLDSLISLMRSPDLTLVGRSDLSLEDIRQLEQDYQSRFMRSTTDSAETTDISNEIFSIVKEEEQAERISPPHFVHSVKEVFSTIIAMKRLSDELREMEGNVRQQEDENENNDEEYKVEEELPEIDLILNKRKAMVADDNKILPLREFSGVIDLKVSKNDEFLAAAGPPFSVNHGAVVVQPFQWSKSPIKDLPHVGQADVWNFEPVKPKWVWN